MRVAIIAPVDMLELAALTDYHLILPHMMENDTYARFYTEVGGFKILDNGAAEPSGLVVDPNELHEIGISCGVSDIVVPDELSSCDRTIELARAFSRSARPGQFGYIGVAQGNTLAEIIKCVNYFSHCDWITTLALPRILCKMHKMQRYTLVEGLYKEYAQDFPGGFHLLGASEWIREILAIDELGLVRGVDTSLPIVMGLAGWRITDEYTARRPNYFSEQVDRNTTRWRLIRDNVGTYLEWAGAFNHRPPTEKTPSS